MIKITDNAKEKMINILNEQQLNHLRFGLQGGGCNGFTYYFSIEDEGDQEDISVSLGDKHFLVIDPMSLMYLEEAEIDYKKDLMGESFVFNNPNQKTSCGCGSSVSFG